jgi:hypothetical protein
LEIPPASEEGGGFFGVRDVDVVSGDRIAVLDGDGKKVVLFDDEGKLLTQYGREGSGPGEFQYPLELTGSPGGGVFVFDVMNRRLERFDSALVPLAPDPLLVHYSGGRMAFAGGFLVLPTGDPDDPRAGTQILTALSDTDTLEIVRYRRERTGPIQLESCGMRLSGISPIFGATTLWATGPEARVAVLGTGRYEIDVYRGPDFHLERRIRRMVPPIPATKELAEATVGDGMRVMTPAEERVCDASEVVEKRGFAREVPPVAGVAVSPGGEILLQRWAPEGEPRSTDVLSANGDYVGTLPAGFPFPRAFLGNDRIVVTEEDEMELTSVVVYRIQR